jgi:hypothetical protein
MTVTTTTTAEPEDDAEALTATDLMIVAALAVGRTWNEAAAAAGTSRATIARRLRVPEVRRALDTERQRVAAEVSDRLCGVMPAVVARLHHIATESESERETINASRVLLAEARAWRDHRWLTERLEAVEDALARQRGVS